MRPKVEHENPEEEITGDIISEPLLGISLKQSIGPVMVGVIESAHSRCTPRFLRNHLNYNNMEELEDYAGYDDLNWYVLHLYFHELYK